MCKPLLGIAVVLAFCEVGNAQLPFALEAEIEEVAVGPDEHIYISGSFNGTYDVDPGPDEWIISGDENSFYVAELDRDGVLLNAFSVDSIEPTFINPHSIIADETAGIVIGGRMSGTVDFDPGPGVAILDYLTNGFLARYTLDGTLLYAFNVGAGDFEDQTLFVRHVSLDNKGGLYVTGEFEGTVDFDPGPREAIYTSQAWKSAYQAHFDFDGNFLDVLVLASDFRIDFRKSESDPTGGYAVLGYLHGLADFDPGPGETIVDHKGYFVARYSVGRQLRSVLLLPTTTGGGFARAFDFHVDESGALYVAGYFNSTMDFDPGPGTYLLTSTGTSTGFLAKYQADDSLSFAIPLGGEEQILITTDAVVRVESGGVGGVLISGMVRGDVDFDPGPGTHILSSAYYIARYFTNGTFDFVFPVEGVSFGSGPVRIPLTLENGDTFLANGAFSGLADFDPGPEEVILEGGSGAYFLARFTTDGAIVVPNEQPQTISEAIDWHLVPNPTQDDASLVLTSETNSIISTIEIFDVLGRRVGIVSESNLMRGDRREIDLDTSGLPAGHYIILVTSERGRSAQRITKLR